MLQRCLFINIKMLKNMPDASTAIHSSQYVLYFKGKHNLDTFTLRNISHRRVF